MTTLAILLASLVFIPLGTVLWWCLPESGAATLAIGIFILAMIGAAAS
jgi:hypothetical protein